ncbi:hypothetical protein U717_14040 [Rhodobacter capsulatus R121]|nr:hypothetical protein U714_13875 [Rhodobacter capsulatus DE442]ETD75447.1 hypothetical protein U717_14040 [Rhodobacter capsulatus R121]ETE52980.1 hypothetical protein U715_14035 [Rhodobacter capsulatus Y262]
MHLCGAGPLSDFLLPFPDLAATRRAGERAMVRKRRKNRHWSEKKPFFGGVA